MKAKLLAFLGLIIATMGAVLTMNAAPVHASGEKYEWINPTTIRASGGLYNNVNAAKNGVIDFPQQGDGTFQITSKGDCDITMTITVTSADNTQAKLVTKGCDGPAKDFDRDLTITHPEKGPVGYDKADCTNATQNRGNQGKCVAVQACMKTGQTADDCSTAYDTCLTNHTVDGKISDADKKACTDNVTKGQLDAANASPAKDNKTSCAIQGIGWIVCPVTNFLAKIVDAAYGFVSSLLTVQPLLTTGASKGVYDAWSIMRNFANVAFVIAFLVIIFAQVTSIGITNYGIKRMLPRLIISAILVNISYWVCAIAIDVSNILGTSLTDLFNSLKASVNLPDAGDFGASGSGWEGIAGGILAGTAVAAAAIYIGLSALLPMLLAALLAIVTVFLVLALRQALIILLVVVAPLAFVAYLLPNTETWFKKWRELFQTLLLMFPIISLIFGASALASKIVMGTATGDYAIAIKLMGAGISIIPLAITPIVMKSAGGLLNRFGGIINNPNKGPFDRMRKGAEGYRKNRQEYRQLKVLNGYRTLPGRGIPARMGARREAVLNSRKSELNRTKSSEIAELAANNEGFRKKLAQGGMDGAEERALAQAINVQAKLQADEVTAANAIIKNANLEGDIGSLQKLAMGTGEKIQFTDVNGVKREMTATKGSALQTAAIQQQFKIGDVEKTDQLVMNSAKMDAPQRQAIAEGMGAMSGKVAYYGGSSGDKVAKGDVGSEADLNGLVADTINKGKFSATSLAGSDKDALERMSKVASDFKAKDGDGNMVAAQTKDSSGNSVDISVNATAKAALVDAADKAMNDPTIVNKPSQRNAVRLTEMGAGRAFTGVADNPETFKDMAP